MSSQPPSTQLCRYLTALPLALSLAIGLLSSAVHALPDDRQQPIHISSDHALRNEKEGITIYSGNVRMDQGSLQISADKITIYRIVDEADKIVARGQPAQLQQQPDAEKAPVTASAGVIEYYKNEDRVHLKQNAQIIQDGSKVTGETIEYYIEKELVKADSNLRKENSRVEVVIPAQALEKSEEPRGAADSE